MYGVQHFDPKRRENLVSRESHLGFQTSWARATKLLKGSCLETTGQNHQCAYVASEMLPSPGLGGKAKEYPDGGQTFGIVVGRSFLRNYPECRSTILKFVRNRTATKKYVEFVVSGGEDSKNAGSRPTSMHELQGLPFYSLLAQYGYCKHLSISNRFCRAFTSRSAVWPREKSVREVNSFTPKKSILQTLSR